MKRRSTFLTNANLPFLVDGVAEFGEDPESIHGLLDPLPR
jgi:hypothetical protein